MSERCKREDSEDDEDGEEVNLGAALLVYETLLTPAQTVPHQALGYVHTIDVLGKNIF